MATTKSEFLETHGFVRLCNILDQPNGQKLRDEGCEIVESQNFKNMIQFADAHMIPLLKTNLGWESPRFGRTFMSNNDNPHAWHRDVYSKDKAQYPQQYTILLYLDSTELNVYSGTHKTPSFSLLRFLDTTTIAVHRGDIVVLYSHLLHRGRFDSPFKPRRMIQLFEGFPNRQIQEKVDKQRDFLTLANPESQKNRVE
eukprot:323122_1